MRRMLATAVLALACGVAILSPLSASATLIQDPYSLPQNDPNLAIRNADRALRKAAIGFQDLQQAGLTNLPDYAPSIRVPSGSIGGQLNTKAQAEYFEYATVNGGYFAPKTAAARAAAINITSVDDYERVYASYGFTPIGLTGWKTDGHTGELRMTYYTRDLRLATSLPSFVSTPALLADLAANRLYEANYQELYNSLITDRVPSCDARYALFRKAVPSSPSSPMLPLGVQVGSVWYTPSDTSSQWLYAKIAANCMATGHQFAQHAYSHSTLQPIFIAGKISLAEQHPVRALTDPAVEFNNGVIVVAFGFAIKNGTGFNTLMMGGSAAIHHLATREAAKPYAAQYFEAELASRGLQNVAGLKWRDDVRMHAQAIDEYVDSVLDAYYTNDAAVVADVELQDWAAAIADPARGAVTDFPSAFTTRAQLKAVVAHILLTVVRHHQDSLLTMMHATMVVPYSPTRLYCDAPTTKAAMTPQQLLACLGTWSQAVDVVNFAVGADRHFAPQTTLLYAGSQFSDSAPRAQAAQLIYSIRNKLIHRQFESRSRTGVLPMLFLDPEIMPQSTLV